VSFNGLADLALYRVQLHRSDNTVLLQTQQHQQVMLPWKSHYDMKKSKQTSRKSKAVYSYELNWHFTLLPIKDLILQLKKLLQRKFVFLYSFNGSSTFHFKWVFILPFDI
jgi:hypothetical protein